MRVIHKYGPYGAGQEFKIEGMYRVVHFGEQAGQLYVWVEKNLDVGIKRDQVFLIVGTGWDYETIYEHKGTAIDSNLFVWHLLQVRDVMANFADRIF